ncbi:hypothetical protein G6F57_022385 [Rhizopus arrhizus]|nr:hypothetical protein G6F57_022385 [Rhizopus arrhizus]
MSHTTDNKVSHSIKAKSPEDGALERLRARELLAERTGLEPATPGVTGRYSNQLNYRSAAAYSTTLSLQLHLSTALLRLACQKNWRPLVDSNPCTHRERVMS